jgi:hypothetical protein
MYNHIYANVGLTFFPNHWPLEEPPQVEDVDYEEVNVTTKESADSTFTCPHSEIEDYESHPF